MLLEPIRFDRALRDVRLASGGPESEPESDHGAAARAEELARHAAEVTAAREAGYRQGRAEADAAFTEQLMMQRQEVLALAEGVLRRLSDQEAALKAQATNLDELAQRGYGNERLDQLVVDVLLGLR